MYCNYYSCWYIYYLVVVHGVGLEAREGDVVYPGRGVVLEGVIVLRVVRVVVPAHAHAHIEEGGK